MLFSSVDTNRAAHQYWLGEEDRNFDVALYVYRGECPDAAVEYCEKRKDFKYPNFYEFSKKVNVLRYAAVLLIDDDIQITTPEINKLFEIFSDNGLWLAQPAYDKEAASSWDISFVDDRYYLRYTNFVENGVALMSRAALKKCLPSLNMIKSGWGADFVWPFLLKFPPNKIAVIDAVQCHHPKSTSALNEVMPRQLHRWEGEFLMSQFSASYFAPRVLGGKLAMPSKTTRLGDNIGLPNGCGDRSHLSSCAGGKGVSKQLQKHLRRARRHLMREEFESAEECLKEATMRWPENSLPYIEYAKVAFARKEYRECIARWSVVVEKFSPCREAIIAIGVVHMELGEFEQADRLLNELHEREKGELEQLHALLGEARARISDERFREAELLYCDAETLWPHRIAPFMHHHKFLERVRRTRDD